MGKSIQQRKKRIDERFKAIVSKNFFSYKEAHAAVEKRIGEKVAYHSFLKCMYGDFISGPKAEAIMKAVSELVKKPIETLWPELKDAA